MNRKDRAILVGMVLGDGYVRTQSAADTKADRRTSAQIYFGHTVRQQAYASWKLDKLNKMFGGKATLRFGNTTSRYGEHKMCYANKSNPYFKTLKGMMYQDGKKKITPQVLDMLSTEGIAIWFMDDGSYRINKRPDGSVSSVSLTISTYCSLEEVEAIQTYFRQTWDIEWKKAYCKKAGLWYVRTSTSNARKLAGLIGKYVISSMQYKLSCVQDLDRHERPTPEKTCIQCNKQFAALKAKGLCMKCYNDNYFNKLAEDDRTCSMCSKTESAKWFVGSRCRACYQRQQRSG